VAVELPLGSVPLASVLSLSIVTLRRVRFVQSSEGKGCKALKVRSSSGNDEELESNHVIRSHDLGMEKCGETPDEMTCPEQHTSQSTFILSLSFEWISTYNKTFQSFWFARSQLIRRNQSY
jgi:hypothetical protein